MTDFARLWLADPVVGRIVAVVTGIVVIAAVVRFAQRSVNRYVEDPDARYRSRKLLSFFGYAAAAVYLTVVFQRQLGNLTVFFGVAGAGIAFALQEVIASVAGWGAIVVSRFFTVGDRVRLGGIRGDVIDIGVLRTTLMECGDWVDGDLYNGRIVRIANSFVFKEPVFNYSADFPFLWDELTVPVRYGGDPTLARTIIERVLREVVGEYTEVARHAWDGMVRKFRIEEAQVDPWVALVATDNWIRFTARYVVDYRRRRATKDRIFTRLLEEIAASDGKVAMASATFEIVGLPPVDVRVRS